MAFALTVFIVNALLKCVPDWIVPFQLGPDSVYDRAQARKNRGSVDKVDNDEGK